MITPPLRDFPLIPIALAGSLAALDAVRDLVAADVLLGLAVLMVATGAGVIAAALAGWIRENWG